MKGNYAVLFGIGGGRGSCYTFFMERNTKINLFEECNINRFERQKKNGLYHLMNLKNNYHCVNDETNLSEVNILDVWPIIHNFEANIDEYLNSESLKNIKRCFWENKDKNFFKNEKFNIGVHIRRPNSNDNRIEGADTPLKYYFDVIDKIKQN